MNKTIRNTVGFFSFDSCFLQQTEGVKKSLKVHRCDQCPYKSVNRSNFARQSHSKPKKEKKIGVYYCVKGCHYFTKNTFNFNRHIETCRRFKVTRPKTRPLITSYVCDIANYTCFHSTDFNFVSLFLISVFVLLYAQRLE